MKKTFLRSVIWKVIKTDERRDPYKIAAFKMILAGICVQLLGGATYTVAAPRANDFLNAKEHVLRHLAANAAPRRLTKLQADAIHEAMRSSPNAPKGISQILADPDCWDCADFAQDLLNAFNVSQDRLPIIGYTKGKLSPKADGITLHTSSRPTDLAIATFLGNALNHAGLQFKLLRDAPGDGKFNATLIVSSEQLR